MTLQAELDALMAAISTQIPAAALAPAVKFYAEDLKAPGRFPDVIGVGRTAPDFTLPDALGKTVSLAGLRARGPVILSFYRGAWCPFCNIELRALQQALPEIHRLGAELVAISPEKPDYSMPLVEREKLQFPVLSDLGNTVARQLGLVFRLEGAALETSRNLFGLDLLKSNGDDSWELPVPATLLLDREGTVRFIHFDPDFRNRVEPAALLSALAAL